MRGWGLGVFEIRGVPCLGVFIVRILLFRGTFFWGPLFSETPILLSGRDHFGGRGNPASPAASDGPGLRFLTLQD